MPCQGSDFFGQALDPLRLRHGRKRPADSGELRFEGADDRAVDASGRDEVELMPEPLHLGQDPLREPLRHFLGRMGHLPLQACDRPDEDDGFLARPRTVESPADLADRLFEGCDLVPGGERGNRVLKAFDVVPNAVDDRRPGVFPRILEPEGHLRHVALEGRECVHQRGGRKIPDSGCPEPCPPSIRSRLFSSARRSAASSLSLMALSVPERIAARRSSRSFAARRPQ